MNMNNAFQKKCIRNALFEEAPQSKSGSVLLTHQWVDFHKVAF